MEADVETKHKHIYYSALIFSLSLLGLILFQGVGSAATLTITSNNGSVIATPDKVDYDPGEVVELRPKTDTGYYFSGWAGDAQGKRLLLELTMDSNKTIIANFDVWQPPIGIPMPEFGIFETHYMYEGQTYDFSLDPARGIETYPDAGNGPYTHYVDNTHPNATDDNNPYGTEERPRVTIPYDGLDSSHHYIVPLQPGDVMEIHGIHDLKQIRLNGWLDGYLFTGGGTSEKPAFVRGSEPNNPAVITTNQPDGYGNSLVGSYIILENFVFNNSRLGLSGSNSAIRNSEIYNVERVNGRAVSISGAKDFVFYNNNVHHNWGTWPDGTKDMHNVVVVGHSERVWVVDNELHHASYRMDGTIAATGGDGIQVMGSGDDPSIWPSKIFIGRNDIHHNTENSVDIKRSHNVVISQNEAYGDGRAPYSSASMINHEQANNTWFIFNKIHDARVGIRPEEALGAAFIIGNVIYNIKYPVTSGTIYGNFVGGVWVRIVETHIIGNTFYNVTGGALIPQSIGDCTIINNLVSRVQVPYPDNASWYHAGVESNRGASDRTLMDYNLFHQPMGVEGYTPEGTIKLRWGSGDYEGLESFQASVGQCLNSIEADPLFTDPANNDFSLQQGSPAIDSATNAGKVQEVMDKYYNTFGVSIQVDIEGTPRPQGSGWDIGAYEYADGGSLPSGDVTGDGIVNVQDILGCVSVILGTDTDTGRIARSDVNGDSSVNVVDLLAIVQIILGG